MSTHTQQIRNWLLESIRLLVDGETTGIEVLEEENLTDYSTTIILSVNPKEINVGQIIGKEGRLANALRILAKAMGMKRGKKLYIEIRSSENGERIIS